MPLIQFLHQIVSRTHLPAVASALAEHRKLNRLRIVVGLIFLTRHLLIFAPYYLLREVYDLTPWQRTLSLGGVSFQATIDAPIGLSLLLLVAYLCFTVGFFTPVATLALIVLASIYDSYFMAEVVGLDMQVFVLCLFGFFLAKTGSMYSVDSWLLRSRLRWPKRVIGRLYGGPTLPDAQLLRVIYFVLFVGYALVSLSAALLHLGVPHWLDGSIIGAISVDPVFNPSTYEFFVALRDHFPSLFWAYSVLGGGSQLFWELAMLLLIFNRFGKWFIVWQGVGFFTICIFTLSLKALPYVEFVLWAILFWRGRSSARDNAWAGEAPLATVAQPGRQINVFANIVAIHVLIFVINFPLFVFKYKKSFAEHKVADYLRYVALPYPEVFNERVAVPIGFSVLYRQNADGSQTLVPFRTPNGGRLLFDRFPSMYFGQAQFSQKNHEMIMLLDYKINGLRGDVTYIHKRYNSILKASPVQLSESTQTINFEEARQRATLAKLERAEYADQIGRWFKANVGRQDSVVFFESIQPGAVDLHSQKLLTDPRYQLFATPPGRPGLMLAPPVRAGWQELLEWPTDTTKMLKIRQLVPKNHRLFMLWNGNLSAPPHPQVQYLHNLNDKVLIAEIVGPGS
jgi:hypothetical protein